MSGGPAFLALLLLPGLTPWHLPYGTARFVPFSRFLREHLDQAALIADFLSVRDRTTFLVTHK